MRKNFSSKNNKGKGNGNKSSFNKFKDKDKDTSEMMEVGEDKRRNDLDWYVPSAQILNDSANVPYSIPVGMPFARQASFNGGCVDSTFDDAIPGILVATIMPTYGNAKTPSDSVNVATNGMYQFVRSKISGSRPYDAVDFLIYLGAVDSLFTLFAWCTRLYATAYTYHEANRYLSRALIESQGVDYDNLLAFLPQFRTGLNVRMKKVEALCVPSVLPIFRRHTWIFSNYYIEGEAEKDQIYLYNPDGYYVFDLDASGAGYLKAQALPNQGALTVQAIFSILDSMIDPIFADEDFNRISGDLLKAYEGNVIKLTEIPDIATVSLVYNPEVLLQFKNAKFKHVHRADASVPGAFYNNFFDLYQSPNKDYLITQTPVQALCTERLMGKNANEHSNIIDGTSSVGDIATMSGVFGELSKATLITSPHRSVTAGETMINTRLTLAFEITDDVSSPFGCRVDNMFFGSEWPDRFSLWTYHRNRTNGQTNLIHRIFERAMVLFVDTSIPDITRIYQVVTSQLPIMSSFKYLPEIAIIFGDTNNSQFELPGRSIFEVDNYALVDSQVMNNLHNTAIMGEYNIPNVSIKA